MVGWRLKLLLALAPGTLGAQGKPATGGSPPPHLHPPPPTAARAVARGTIAIGDTVRDSLARTDILLPAESTYAQQWLFQGHAGETVTIDLVSDAFDAYLFLLGPALASGAPASLPQDDDSGGRCNARLTVRLPANGDYLIVATSSDRLATGRFTLTVTAGPKPAALTPCTR